MATRRSNALSPTTPQTISEAQGGRPSEVVSDTRPAVPSDVIVKLLAFTFAMAVFPIGSYFFTLKYVFGNPTYSGAFAAVMANVVLIGYIVVAMREDEASHPLSKTGVDVLKREVQANANAEAKKEL